MYVFECYALSSPQINNGPFHFASEEKEYAKCQREKKKVNIIRKKEREEMIAQD